MYSNRYEPLVCPALQHEQRLEFQRHEQEPEQQQREQHESVSGGLEFTKYTYDRGKVFQHITKHHARSPQKQTIR